MFFSVIFIYLVLYLVIYFKVSALNKSYMNAYTTSMGYIFLLQGCGLLMEAYRTDFSETYSTAVLAIFSLSLIIGILFQYLGYYVAFRSGFQAPFLNVEMSRRKTKLFMAGSVVLMIVSFILLGVRGVGVMEWIFNTRESYIIGRAGNGVYYVLFEVFLFTALAAACYYKLRYKKKGLVDVLIVFLLIATYFTGSKAVILSAILTLVFVYDVFKKKIKLGRVFLLGAVGLIFIELLLRIQSGIGVLNYISGDFYNNYLNEIQAIHDGKMSFYYGRISFENFFYSLVPRGIFPNKPYVYGTSRLPAFFYGDESVILGNTPSFSAYGAAYADFAWWGSW